MVSCPARQMVPPSELASPQNAYPCFGVVCFVFCVLCFVFCVWCLVFIQNTKPYEGAHRHGRDVGVVHRNRHRRDACFRVSGFGFRVQGSGFRVSGFGFRVSGFGFRVSGSGFGFRVSGSGFAVDGAVDVPVAVGDEHRRGQRRQIPHCERACCDSFLTVAPVRIWSFSFRNQAIGFNPNGSGLNISGFGYGDEARNLPR